MTLQSRLDRGRCRAAPPGTAAVHLRLGDKPDIYMHVVTDRGKDKSYGPRVPIYQQAAALGARRTSPPRSSACSSTPSRIFGRAPRRI